VHDLIIRNATVCDGTGRPAFEGDIAIDGDRIAAITPPGQLATGSRAAGEEIDASGLVAAPGFIDVHTHYDCQLFWDPTASPSPWHGVTTVVMGNCGFTIAPCRPADRETVMELLLYVEGMPIETLRAGIRWSWEEFPDYLAALDRQGVGPNVAAFIGMSAVRFKAMGRAAVERAATDAEIVEMQRLVRDGLRAGAIGWSTSLSPTHFFGDGTPAPTRFADERELRALAEVSREFAHGVIEVAPRSLIGTPDDKLAEQSFFAELARISGKVVSWAPLLDTQFAPGSAQHILGVAEGLQRDGVKVVPQVGCRPLEVRFDFTAPCFGLENNAFWKPIMHKSRDERRALFKSREFRDELRAFSGKFIAALTPGWEHMFVRVARRPSNRSLVDRSIAELAGERTQHPVDTFCDLVLEEDLATQWGVTMMNAHEPGVAELLQSPAGLLALSDAGAHVDTLCDQGFSSYLLGHWVRDRGLIALEEAVRLLTSRPAEIYGIVDRGMLAPGKLADVVLFDAERVQMRPAELVSDLPGGQSRLLQRAEGIPCVLVNGKKVVDQGAPTAALAGRVLRGS